jgi:hypothetical protein
MRNRTALDYKGRLDRLFAAVPPTADELIRSHWARYLCVLVSGFLEVAVASLFDDFTDGCSAPQVTHYVSARLAGFQNPKMEKIIQLTQDFNPTWAETLRTRTDGRIKDAVDSIVATRHKVAHGENVGITYARMRDYYNAAVECVEILEDVIDPPRP